MLGDSGGYCEFFVVVEVSEDVILVFCVFGELFELLVILG